MKLLGKETRQFSRREFCKLLLGTGLAYLLYESIFFVVSVEAAKHIKISEHTILSHTLDSQWDETYIVHFSDMHISPRNADFINPGVIQELSLQITQYLQEANADPAKTFFIDTGDMVSSRTATGGPTPIIDLEESIAYIRDIPAARFFAVPGNHEYGHAWTNLVLKKIESEGIELLADRRIDSRVESNLPFTLIGLPDFTSQGDEWYKKNYASDFGTVANATMNKPIIVATHTSIADVWGRGILEDELSGVLFLHGHTHGGQIGAPSPGQKLASTFALQRYHYLSKYYRGIHEVGENKQNIVSVSSGIGHAVGHRVRTVKPEVVIYKLKAA